MTIVKALRRTTSTEPNEQWLDYLRTVGAMLWVVTSVIIIIWLAPAIWVGFQPGEKYLVYHDLNLHPIRLGEPLSLSSDRTVFLEGEARFLETLTCWNDLGDVAVWTSTESAGIQNKGRATIPWQFAGGQYLFNPPRAKTCQVVLEVRKVIPPNVLKLYYVHSNIQEVVP